MNGFDGIRDEISRKFAELKRWVLNIPDDREYAEFSMISKGLFCISLWGL